MPGAVILFSGGQDSTTCLYWARERWPQLHALSIDYGQRHRVELQQAQQLAQRAGVPWSVLPMPFFQHLGANALTDAATAVEPGQPNRPTGQVPNTFVPARNAFFLTAAAAKAYQLGWADVVAGMGQADYSGYPDCRQPFVQALQTALQLGMDQPALALHTPLMHLDKAAIWQMAHTLGCLDEVVAHTHTCYNGSRTPLHPWGAGCGTCDACLLRARGYYQAFGSPGLPGQHQP